jgi:hypothetical protein
VLAYLAGWLRKLAANSAKTRMTARNLAICFAPNLVPADSATVADMGKRADTSVDFVEAVILGLDTTGIFPLPSGALP